MTKTEPHVTERKRNEVEAVRKLINEYKVMGIVNLENLPAFNYMKILYSLKGKILLKYTKKRLIKIAFDEANDAKLLPLKEKLEGIPALIFTNEDPFRLAQILKKSKSKASAKAGDIAPIDIIISSGPTDFAPGPMIGELGALGIKTKVENGKITIVSEKLLVKSGSEINEKSAAIMSKLKIEPMEIGLNLVLTYQNGEITDRAVLNIDVEEYENNVKIAAGESMSLAVSIGYICSDTINLLIAKAVRQGDSLAEKSKFNEKINDLSKKQEAETRKSEKPPEKPKSEDKESSGIPQHIEKKIEKEIKEEAKANADSSLDGPNKEEKIQNEKMIVSGISDVSDDDIKKAQDTLRDLTNKKIRGEI